MIDHDAARKIATDLINERNREPEDEAVILDQFTIEKEYGWIFFYNSRLYLETHNIRYTLCGNAPVIVEKEAGSCHYTGTAEEIEYHIKRYERRRRHQKFWAKFALFKRLWR